MKKYYVKELKEAFNAYDLDSVKEIVNRDDFDFNTTDSDLSIWSILYHTGDENYPGVKEDRDEFWKEVISYLTTLSKPDFNLVIDEKQKTINSSKNLHTPIYQYILDFYKAYNGLWHLIDNDKLKITSQLIYDIVTCDDKEANFIGEDLLKIEEALPITDELFSLLIRHCSKNKDKGEILYALLKRDEGDINISFMPNGDDAGIPIIDSLNLSYHDDYFNYVSKRKDLDFTYVYRDNETTAEKMLVYFKKDKKAILFMLSHKTFDSTVLSTHAKESLIEWIVDHLEKKDKNTIFLNAMLNKIIGLKTRDR